VGSALEAAADVGVLVEEAKAVYHGHFAEWLREHVPSLSVEQAEAYHGVHRVRKRRECLNADHRQMKLLGIIGDDDLEDQGGSSTAQRAGHGRWVKWASHVVQHFREVEEKKPIEQWEDFERKALIDILEPIHKIWERASMRNVRTSKQS